MLSTARGNARPQLPRHSRCMELGEGSTRGSTPQTSHTSQTYAYDLVILDDGHQHRKLVRDTNILMINCLDASLVRSSSHHHASGPTPTTGVRQSLELGGQLLPRGTLRESVATALGKADVIVVHNSDLLPPSELSALCDAVNTACRASPHAAHSSTQALRAHASHQVPPMILTCTQVSSIRPLLPISHHASLPRGAVGTGGTAEAAPAAREGVGCGVGLGGGEGRARGGGSSSGGVESAWGRSIAPKGGRQDVVSAHISHMPTPLESTNRREGCEGGGAGVSVAGKEVVGVAALANPAAFFLKLQSLGVQRLFERPYPDHHAFSHSDLVQLVCEQCALLPADPPPHTRDSSTRSLAVTIVTTDKVRAIEREMQTGQ